MKKVFQTIVDSENGNCAQAAMASLFDCELKDVPNFIEHGSEFLFVLFSFLEEKGHKHPTVVSINQLKEETIDEAVNLDGGINGFFYASVNSQTFKGASHAVIVDKSLNVVHDPNPNQKALGLDRSYVNEIIFPNGVVINIKTEKVVTMKKYLSN